MKTLVVALLGFVVALQSGQAQTPVDEWVGSLSMTTSAEQKVAVITFDRAKEDQDVDNIFIVINPSEDLTEPVAEGTLRFAGVMMPPEPLFMEFSLKGGKSYLIVTPFAEGTEPRTPGARPVHAARVMRLSPALRKTHEAVVKQLLDAQVNWSQAPRADGRQ